MPVPDGTAEPGFTHQAHGKPTATWTYRDAGGAPLFHTCRFNPADGKKKKILPRTWGTMDGKTGWHWLAPLEPRPLYRLDALAARPDDPVLIVEGEKAADAAAELLPDHVAVSWPGGAGATLVSKEGSARAGRWDDAHVVWHPGSDWEAIPTRAVLPPGAHVRLDGTTGQQQARMLP